MCLLGVVCVCVPPCGFQGTPRVVWLPGQVPFSDEPSHGPKKKILKSKAQFFKKKYIILQEFMPTVFIQIYKPDTNVYYIG